MAILLGLPADMVTVLVCLHLRRLTYSGAVWLRSDNSVTSVIHSALSARKFSGVLILVNCIVVL